MSWSRNCPNVMNNVVICLSLPVLTFSTWKSCLETAFGGGRSGFVPGKPLGVSSLPSLAYADST